MESIKLTAEHIAAIEAIIKKGNEAAVKKNKNGVLVLEVKKSIKCGK